MIYYERLYLEFLEESGVGRNDVVASSRQSYVSYLNSVFKVIGTPIYPSLLHSEEDVIRIGNLLDGTRAPKTIRNYQSAMRQYVAMVCKHRLSAAL